jgi:hypothetical protein
LELLIERTIYLINHVSAEITTIVRMIHSGFVSFLFRFLFYNTLIMHSAHD